jgi:hypothetical protein
MSKNQRAFFVLVAFLLLAAVPAAGWEWIYGPAATIDDAFRRVTPVPNCGNIPNPGYIAVGTQDPGGVNSDVYVVYTNAAGAPIWEATYDVQGLGLRDDGMAIVQVNNAGFVFLSNSQNGVWRPALTAIDCFGNVMWSRVYLDVLAGQDLRGNDLIRTQSGDPAFGTAAGNFAVAGTWFNGANDDAFLMRTNALGLLIWNIAYNVGTGEGFNALTEALPVAPAPAGDLVAVGRYTTSTGDQQGLVARVNGNNGAMGVGLQCMQHHGLNGPAEVYNSVIRLAAFFPGQFAMVGTSTWTGPGAWLDDVWVTRGNTCPLTGQARFGNPGGPTSEHGNDIKEVLAAKPLAPVGSLAVAGDHGPAIGGPYDAALMLLTPGLAPIAGAHRIYGDFGPDQETFFSLADDPAGWPAPAGYVLAGLTQTPWAGADPQDLYLVHEDPAVFACELPWGPTRVTTGVPQVNLSPLRRSPARDAMVPTPKVNQLTGIQICAP